MDFQIHLSCVQASDWEIQLQITEDNLLQSCVNEGETTHANLLNVRKDVIKGEVQKLGKGEDSA